MKIGMIGLGKMGEAIAYRAIKAGHIVIGFDPNKDACNHAQATGVQIMPSLVELVQQKLDVVWLMVPQGPLIDTTIDEMEPYLRAGAIVVDGGNTKFTDSIRRAKRLAEKNISFLDCGTSGGLNGRAEGFCLMVGGDRTAYKMLYPLLTAIAAPDGVAHIGPSGSGHYVKMVHNGIEYALLQAYAEGFHVIKEGTFKQDKLDLAQISGLWNHGAVIRSWILELINDIMCQDQEFHAISGEIESTGMGQWTVQEAHEHTISVPVIEESLLVRQQSKETGGNYGTKIVALLRNKFGGHVVKKINIKEKD